MAATDPSSGSGVAWVCSYHVAGCTEKVCGAGGWVHWNGSSGFTMAAENEPKLYADPDNQTYDRVGFYKGVARTFFNPATPLSIKARGDKVSTSVTGPPTARHVPPP